MTLHVLKNNVVHLCVTYNVRGGFIHHERLQIDVGDNIRNGIYFGLVCEKDHHHDDGFLYSRYEGDWVGYEVDVNCMACLAAECT